MQRDSNCGTLSLINSASEANEMQEFLCLMKLWTVVIVRLVSLLKYLFNCSAGWELLFCIDFILNKFKQEKRW